MYLISAYFDNASEKRLQRLIEHTAKATGNTFMVDHGVPPHLTIAAFETRNPEQLLLGNGSQSAFGQVVSGLKPGKVPIVSAGAFFPYVMYVTPVFNAYLISLQKELYEYILGFEDITVNRFYRPMEWFPHITVGKTLTEQQMRLAFETLQKHFAVIEASVVEIGLARTNPHKDLMRGELRGVCEE